MESSQVGVGYDAQLRMVSESLEQLLQLIFVGDIYEGLYLGQDIKIKDRLRTALVNLYVSILEYLGSARKYFKKDTTGLSPLHLPNHSIFMVRTRQNPREFCFENEGAIG